MIILLGRTLVYWTGILTGTLFILSFIGCRCGFQLRGNLFNKIAANHKLFIRLAFISFLIHTTLAILSGLGIYL